MTKELHKDLKSLGESARTKYNYDNPDRSILERFPSPFFLDTGVNPNGVTGDVTIEIPEFTSLCPKTGQPDFAKILIDYTPLEWCVESKSLKLYIMSFRNHGEFHESCVNRICNDLVDLLNPRWIRVEGQFTPRGGIPFWPIAQWENPESISLGGGSPVIGRGR